MTTKSTVAQLIVAEHFREQVEGSEKGEEKAEKADKTTEENGQNSETPEPEETLEKHSAVWYEPDTEKYDYAVYPPDSSDKKRKYYKTASGAAGRLIEWFE